MKSEFENRRRSLTTNSDSRSVTAKATASPERAPNKHTTPRSSQKASKPTDIDKTQESQHTPVQRTHKASKPTDIDKTQESQHTPVQGTQNSETKKRKRKELDLVAKFLEKQKDDTMRINAISDKLHLVRDELQTQKKITAKQQTQIQKQQNKIEMLQRECREKTDELQTSKKELAKHVQMQSRFADVSDASTRVYAASLRKLQKEYDEFRNSVVKEKIVKERKLTVRFFDELPASSAHEQQTSEPIEANHIEEQELRRYCFAVSCQLDDLLDSLDLKENETLAEKDKQALETFYAINWSGPFVYNFETSMQVIFRLLKQFLHV